MLAKEASDPVWDALCWGISCWTADEARALLYRLPDQSGASPHPLDGPLRGSSWGVVGVMGRLLSPKVWCTRLRLPV